MATCECKDTSIASNALLTPSRTGPAAEINFMGYARAGQTGHGIHQRLWARAFIVSDDSIAIREPRPVSPWSWWLSWWETPLREPIVKPNRTICFVSMDIGMGSDVLNLKVLDRLAELAPDSPCILENLSLSGTHTHSAPAGFLQYALFQITSLGYSSETMHAYVEGVAQALAAATRHLQPGTLELAEGDLVGANINRSPSSYQRNPQPERDLYPEGDTDKRMLQLSFDGLERRLGVINWFAVHGTSMNSSNKLISGDNKGYASYLMEKHFNQDLPGHGVFVAAFASTNLGDVSPNTKGPRCIDTGLPCDFNTSTCNGKTEMCVAAGPGDTMFESTEIIGRMQFDQALELMGKSATRIEGRVSFRHSFLDMANLTVTLPNGNTTRTCPAALGYSFAAGTTDGPGDFDFTQGRNTSNPFWNMISGFLSIPSKEEIDCQRPKPILLNTGSAKIPYHWDPNTIPISLFRIGSLFIANVPGEFSTMAGRRLRTAIRSALLDGGVQDPVVTIAGLANSYSHYITTEEEYAAQRYEAASTLYGPHTLAAYIQEFERITIDLLQDRPSQSRKGPKDHSKRQLSLITPVEIDAIGWGHKFGSIAVDANEQYARGNDTAIVSFRSANPRNNLRLNGTFLSVDKLSDDGSWERVYVDGDWCTTFVWKGGIGYYGSSFAEIHWDIPVDAEQGLYRVCHYGTRRRLLSTAESTWMGLPDIITSNVVGSFIVSALLSCFEFLVSMSTTLQDLASDVGRSKLVDFEGCSRTFLVTA